MTAQSVVDYSFPPHPSLQSIIDAGYVGVVRYLAPLPNPKVILKPEADALHSAGLSTTLVFEWYNQRAAQTGYAGGQVDARIAIKQAQDLGMHPGSCIYYVLEDPTRIPVSQWPVVGAYLQGVGDVHRDTGFLVGGYGSQDLVESCIYAGTITYGWQVGGWSHSVSPHCHLYQRLGYVLDSSSDENACLQDDWGQWPRVAPPPEPKPEPEPEDNDVANLTICAKPGDAQQYVTDMVTFKSPINGIEAWNSTVWCLVASGAKLYYQDINNPIRVPAVLLDGLPDVHPPKT